MTDDRIPVAVRAYPERIESEDSGGGGQRPGRKWPKQVLTVDVETTTDPTQRLLFGYWELSRWTPAGRLQVDKRGLFHADDLFHRDPESHRVLKRSAEDNGLLLESRRSFMKRLFFPVAYQGQQTVCGFNLPFDLTRLAVGAGPARSEIFRGGFSLPLFEYFDEQQDEWTEDKYKPRLCFKTLDSRRAFIGFKKGRDDDRYRPGRFLDLRSLAFALTHHSHSLTSACEAFDVGIGKGEIEHTGRVTEEYIEYCIQDVEATNGLLEKLRAEFDRHPIDLDPDKAFSPASVAKAYLRSIGVVPPGVKFDTGPELLGDAMVGYYGGRAECRIRRTEVPVVYVDVLSMYPTVNSLMGLWEVLVAGELQIEDATEDVQVRLEELDADDVFDPETWEDMLIFAKIRPEEDIVPVRGEYEPETRNLNIGVNQFTADEEFWYPLPDLVASKLLSGQAPEVVEAFRIAPQGTQDGLEPIELGGELETDPRTEDFFQAVIERRKSLSETDLPEPVRERLDKFLKVLANSGSYGIYAEMNPVRLPETGSEQIRVYGMGDPSTVETGKPEEPGEFCFPLLAALTTSAARLMLGLLEHEVTKRGGSYALCDTDSMGIVATEDGGLVPCPGGPHRTDDGREAVRALSWDTVDDIVDRFERLKPYDPELVRDPVLEVEDVNFGPDGQQRELWAFAVSAKRYVLYRRDGDDIDILDAKEHGLGHLLDPVDSDDDDGAAAWIKDIWRCAILESRGEEVDVPDWMDRPAVSRLTVSSYHLYEPFQGLNEGKAYPDQVKPMNFMLAVSTKKFGEPAGVDPTAFRLVAPYIRDPSRWGQMRWINRYTGETHPVTCGGTSSAVEAEVQSYRDVYREYVRHPEWKSAGPEGHPCDRRTEGLLQRRHISPLGVEMIGKETNRLEEVQQDLVSDRDEVLEIFAGGEEKPWEAILHVMDELPREKLAAKAGVSPRTVYRILSGDVQKPTSETWRNLRTAVKQMCNGGG